MTDGARLAEIRAQLDAIAPGEWTRVHDGEGCFIEARTPRGERIPMARFDVAASHDEITFAVDAPGAVRFLLALVDRAIKAVRDAAQPPADDRGAAKDFAAECAMKCAEPAFKAFLEDRHGLERPLTDERVAQRVRSLLGVADRAELNQGGRAAEAWKALRGDFETWKRAGR